MWRRRSPDQRVHRSPLQGRLPRQGHTSTREVFSTYVARRREHLAHLRRHHGTTGARRRPTRRTGRLRETSIWGGDSAHPFTPGTTSWPSLVPTDPSARPRGSRTVQALDLVAVEREDGPAAVREAAGRAHVEGARS